MLTLTKKKNSATHLHIYINVLCIRAGRLHRTKLSVPIKEPSIPRFFLSSETIRAPKDGIWRHRDVTGKTQTNKQWIKALENQAAQGKEKKRSEVTFLEGNGSQVVVN